MLEISLTIILIVSATASMTILVCLAWIVIKTTFFE